MNSPNRLAFISLLTNMHVLVVENDRESGKIYTYLLEDYGATVKLVTSFEEAVKTLDWLVPDILICEMRFSDKKVRALKHKLRDLEINTGKHIPIVFPEESYVTDEAKVGQFTDSMNIRLLQAVGCDYFRAIEMVI